MNIRTQLKSIGNAALYPATCALIGTGLLLEFRMDAEEGAVRLFGMGQDDWGEIHLVVAFTFVALAVLHLALNLAWIRAALARARWGMPLLVGGVGLIAGLLLWPIERPTAAGEKAAHSHHSEQD
jgi:hypothetical protein